MIVRLFIFLIGFGFTVIGFIYIISYLNLLSIGYNFLEYVQFIMKRLECIYAFLGIIIMILDIYIPGGKNELYI